jgi:hypothetical protein
LRHARQQPWRASFSRREVVGAGAEGGPWGGLFYV